jgi:hypothetical protein
VNKEWRERAEHFKGKDNVLIADADRELRNVLIDKALHRQLRINDAVREMSIHLWKAVLPKERREIRGRLRDILHTCRNSALKQLKDGATERLRWRINKTLADLGKLAQELVGDGLTTSAKSLRNSADYTITLARLAMKQMSIPYTNNLIERLMGEIAKRVENEWMHWSTTVLENILNILLARYCKEKINNI